jgi:hypothetical protein
MDLFLQVEPTPVPQSLCLVIVMMVTDTDTYKGKSAAKIFASSVQRKWYPHAFIAVASFALLNTVATWYRNSAAPGPGVQQLQTSTGQEKKCLPLLLPGVAQDGMLFMTEPTDDKECLIDQGASPYIHLLTKVLVGTPLDIVDQTLKTFSHTTRQNISSVTIFPRSRTPWWERHGFTTYSALSTK